MASFRGFLSAAVPPSGLSDGTTRSYATSWRAFVNAFTPQKRFPVGEQAVVGWLVERAKAGRSRRSLSVDRAAIVAWCAANGETFETLPLPTAPKVRPKATKGPSADLLLKAAQRCKPDIAGIRDRALLTISAALDMGPEGMARLQVEDFTDTADGMMVSLLSPRTGRRVMRKLRRRREPTVCPVLSWQVWRDSGQMRFGSAFRAVNQSGLLGGPLSVPGIRFVLERAVGKSRSPVRRKRQLPSIERITVLHHPVRQLSKVQSVDWIRTTLTVSGPTAAVERFEAAARGPGTIPWRVDFDYEQARLLAPMAGMGQQAVTLSRLLREASERLHRIAEKRRASGDQSCPFDLQQLIPIPDWLLDAGEDSSAALTWLQRHWGTVRPLRQVSASLVRDGRVRRYARIVYEFWSADWTPWQALIWLQAEWSELVFDIRPHYDFTSQTGNSNVG